MTACYSVPCRRLVLCRHSCLVLPNRLFICILSCGVVSFQLQCMLCSVRRVPRLVSVSKREEKTKSDKSCLAAYKVIFDSSPRHSRRPFAPLRNGSAVNCSVPSSVFGSYCGTEWVCCVGCIVFQKQSTFLPPVILNPYQIQPS